MCIFINNANSISEVFTPSFVFTCADYVKWCAFTCEGSWLVVKLKCAPKKLPWFLSRLNEVSGGRENMCLVSGSLRRILKFLRMTFLIARFRGW